MYAVKHVSLCSNGVSIQDNLPLTRESFSAKTRFEIEFFGKSAVFQKISGF